MTNNVVTMWDSEIRSIHSADAATAIWADAAPSTAGADRRGLQGSATKESQGG